MTKTKVFAHRGYSAVAPENSMLAFLWAIRVGADGIELDVQLTKDGEVVVIHDETVDRTTNGTGWVKDFTLSEITQLDNGSWFSTEYKDQRVPTLRQVLELVQGSKLELNIELKNSVVDYPDLEQKVIALVEEYDMEEQVIFSTFHLESVHRLHRLRPGYHIAALYNIHVDTPWKYAELLGINGIHPHYSLVTDDLVKESSQRGITVRPYTVDDPIEMERLFRAGVDAIITNVPPKCISLRQSLGMD